MREGGTTFSAGEKNHRVQGGSSNRATVTATQTFPGQRHHRESNPPSQGPVSSN